MLVNKVRVKSVRGSSGLKTLSCVRSSASAWGFSGAATRCRGAIAVASGVGEFRQHDRADQRDSGDPGNNPDPWAEHPALALRINGHNGGCPRWCADRLGGHRRLKSFPQVIRHRRRRERTQ
jgi:hypothetical protein